MSETTTIHLTPETIDALKRKHGTLKSFRLERGGQEFVVRAPDGSEYERCMDKVADGGRRKVEAVTELGECCVVFPEAGEVSRLAGLFPALFYSAGNMALEMAGLTDGYGVKKL